MPLPPATGPVTLALLVVLGVYLAYEAWRWSSGNRGQLQRGQFVRRMAVGLMLEAVLLMWCLANPLMAGKGAREKLLYMTVATLLTLVGTVLAVVLALAEAAFVSLQYSSWRRDLARKMGQPDLPPDPPE